MQVGDCRFDLRKTHFRLCWEFGVGGVLQFCQLLHGSAAVLAKPEDTIEKQDVQCFRWYFGTSDVNSASTLIMQGKFVLLNQICRTLERLGGSTHTGPPSRVHLSSFHDMNLNIRLDKYINASIKKALDSIGTWRETRLT